MDGTRFSFPSPMAPTKSWLETELCRHGEERHPRACAFRSMRSATKVRRPRGSLRNLVVSNGGPAEDSTAKPA